VKSNNVKEFKVEHIETSSMELRDLNLLKERLTKDTDRDSSESEEHRGEVLKHKLTHIDFPEELNQ